VQVLGEGMKDASQRALTTPLLESSMAGLIRWVAIGKVLPRRTRPQHPEHGIENVARVSPRTATPILAPPRLRNQRLYEAPLLFGAQPRREGSQLIDGPTIPPNRSLLKRVYETGSSRG
jgi:hypothetical protein